MRRAVFFDKDGVVVRALELGDGKTRTPWHFGEFEIMPDVAEMLAAVRECGFLCILASNQPDVTYKKMSEHVWRAIQERVETLGFDDVYICRHGRNEACACKKPKPGMLREAATKWNIDLANSFMVGDTQSDVDTARAAGCQAIVLNWPYNQDVVADYRVKNLLEILFIIKASC